MKKEILRMENVVSEDSRLSNVHNLNLHIFEHEILGLVSLNGYGMEKLLQLICNNTPIKFGRVYFQEELVNSYLHSQSRPNKVYIVEQKSKLIPHMRIYDNIFVMRGNMRKYFVRGKVLRKQLIYFLNKYQLPLSPDAEPEELSVFQRCMAELLKAHIMGARLIIVKDLASFLGTDELLQVKEFLRQLVKLKTAVLYISNLQGDICSICDRAMLMKDGEIKKVLEKRELTPEGLQLYVDAYGNKFERHQINKGERLIQISRLSMPHCKCLDFTMRNGECVILYDREHWLESDLCEFLKGSRECKGEIFYDREMLTRTEGRGYNIKDVAVIDADPVRKMIFYNMNYVDNLSYCLDKKLRGRKVKKRYKNSIQKEYEKYVGREVYTEDVYPLEKKSLYNIVYYRIHLLNPKIVFIIQPFWGVDIFDRHYIAHLIQALTGKGIAVIIATANIPDDFYVADAVYDIKNGISTEGESEDYGLLHSR